MSDPTVRGVKVPGFPPAVGPYADVAIAAGQAWISGIIALDAEGQVVGAGDPDRQIEFTLRQLAAALEAVGATPPDLVHLTNYVTDPALRSIVHRKRELVLPGSRPASTMIVVPEIVVPGLVYEVQAVALVES